MDSPFNRLWSGMMLEQLDIHVQKINLDPDFIPFTNINSRRIIDLNLKCKTIKILEDNIWENLGDLGFDDDLLDITPKASFMKENIGKLDFIINSRLPLCERHC